MRKVLLVLAVIVALARVGSSAAAPIVVPNFSFENRVGSNFDDWTETGAIDAGPNAEGRSPTHGTSLAGVRYGSGSGAIMPWGTNDIKQVLSETIDASKVYSLTVDTANWWNGFNSYSAIELYAWDGVTETRIVKSSVATNNDWKSFSLQASGDELAAFDGQALGIRLTAVTTSNSNNKVAFDNVRLEKTDKAASYGAPAAITILNPSFESGGLEADNWNDQWRAGGAGGWGGYLTIGAQDGSSAISAGDNTHQILSDAFVEGALYTLTGHYWPRFGDHAPALITLGKQEAGDIVYLDGAAIPGIAAIWQEVSFEYIATAADDGAPIVVAMTGAFWDNISLTVQLPQTGTDPSFLVPEPSTFAMGVLGLLVLGAVAYRRRRK